MAAPVPPSAPPQIFDPARRAAALRRMVRRQQDPASARYLFADLAEDTAERIGFLRHVPARSLVLGDPTGAVAAVLPGTVDARPVPDFALDRPWPVGGYDLVAACFALDCVNDLPGALIHARAALAPGGLLLATLLGSGSLPVLRAVMLAADGERPAPRLHPQVDVRAGAQLLQRAGLADPVADARGLTVRFGSLRRLVGDLRDQGLTGVLAQGGCPLGRPALARAEAAFAGLADADGRVTERFELLTLSGWRRPA
ncbi:methyltransferase [Novosphingobium piscinae]|uniref:Methyltransferase n=1 Tax=Novosphingobium piscinae TaxID=1507448 RepID=A0A7X1FZY3_9SPHN|nr:methyltransferase [Novosphingobium piscinae]MBC2669422.1 methyltransferase [Novosphingobium piscinae]